MEEVTVSTAMYSENNIGLSLLAGSLTTYQNRNPSFSVIEFDAEYMVPVNVQTYYMNITKMNDNKEKVGKWERLHDLRGEYSLFDLSPDAIVSGLARPLLTSEPLAVKYLWNMNKKAPAKEPIKGCDKKCR